MSVLEWIGVFAVFIVTGWVLNKILRPQSFASRRIVGVASFLLSWFFIYMITEIAYALAN